MLEAAPGVDTQVNEDPNAKRRRILEETRDIDADDSEEEVESSEEERCFNNRFRKSKAS